MFLVECLRDGGRWKGRRSKSIVSIVVVCVIRDG